MPVDEALLPLMASRVLVVKTGIAVLMTNIYEVVDRA